MRFAEHLCAVDPAGFAAGFALAAGWVPEYPEEAARVRRLVAESSGRPWPVTAALLGVEASARMEGFVLGVYGLVQLERLTGR